MCVFNFYILETNMVQTDYDTKVPSKLSTPLMTCLPKRLLLCFAILTILITLIIVTVIFSIDTYYETERQAENITTGTAKFNVSGHHFFTVEAWGGRPPLYEESLTQPVSYVIISHTAGTQCKTFSECSTRMRNIQSLHVTKGYPNVGYNFVIGGDEDIYEGRGWLTKNFHRDKTIGICFMGNYVYDELTDGMIDALEKLLQAGVEIGVLPEDFKIVAHNQTAATLSPGQNVYKVIKEYPNFSAEMLPQLRD